MTDVFHITHLRNLKSILAEGGLYCDKERGSRRLECTGIAHQHIKDRRAKRKVPVSRGGTLADYVPFYFAPRSPMLYAIHVGAVEGYESGQAEVLHLQLDVEAMVKGGVDFAFTDGHADMGYSNYFDDLADLKRIDWPIMREIYWHDTADDGDRKRRRQAEFLVHNFVSWEFVKCIGVFDSSLGSKVERTLQRSDYKPTVRVRREWYY